MSCRYEDLWLLWTSYLLHQVQFKSLGLFGCRVSSLDRIGRQLSKFSSSYHRKSVWKEWYSDLLSGRSPRCAKDDLYWPEYFDEWMVYLPKRRHPAWKYFHSWTAVAVLSSLLILHRIRCGTKSCQASSIRCSSIWEFLYTDSELCVLFPLTTFPWISAYRILVSCRNGNYRTSGLPPTCCRFCILGLHPLSAHWMALPNRCDFLIQYHIDHDLASKSHTSEGSPQPTNNKRQHRLLDHLLLARIYRTLLFVPSKGTPLFNHLRATFHQVILFE